MPGAGDIRAGAAFVELYLKDNRLTKGLDAAGRRLRAFGSVVSGIGVKLAGLGVGALAGIFAATKMAIGMGDDLAKMSQRTGVSVESLSELGYAATQSGASLDSLETSAKKMAKTITDAADGGKASVETIEALGLSVDQIAGMNPEDQFLAIADALSKIEDPTRRAALAQEIFGRSGTELLPMLEKGAAGIEALRQRARELGLVVSTEDANALVVLGDLFDDLLKSLKMVAFQVGAALAPMLSDLAKRLINIASSVVKWVSENRGVVVSIAMVAAGVVAAGAALIALGGIFSTIGFALSGLATAVGLLGKVFGLARLALLPFTAAAAAGRLVMTGLRVAYLATAAAVTFLKTSTMATSVVVLAARGIWTAITATFALAKGAILGVASASKLAAVGMGILSAVTTGIGTVLGILTSPIALIVAAVAALGFIAFRAAGGLSGIANAGKGIASWAGSAATEIGGKLVAAFKTLWDIGSKTFKGISKALAAGDLAGAGAIGMAGLKVALLTGVQAISQAVGGAFGQFLGTITQQLMKGDFAGAWDTAVKSMAAVFDQFMSGIISAFTGAATMVKEIWASVTKAIARSMINLATKLGVSKQVLGVDLNEETNRKRDMLSNRANVLMDEALRLQKQADDLRTQGQAEAADAIESRIEELTKQAQEAINKAENVSIDDIVSETQDAATEQLDGVANRLQSVLDQIKAGAAEKAEKSAEKLAEDGVAGLDDEALKEAKRELDELIDKYKELAEQAKENAKQAAAQINKGMAFANRLASTFSANAAVRFAGGGQTYAQKTAQATAQTASNTGKVDKKMQKFLDGAGKMNIGPS